MSSPSPVTKTRGYHYYSDGNLVLQVEDTVYRVYRIALTRQSVIFNAIMSIPPSLPASDEGTTDDVPIKLEGVNVANFNTFLDFLFLRFQRSEWTISQISALIEQAQHWMATYVLDSALDLLNTHPAADPALRLQLAVKYNLPLDRFEEEIHAILTVPLASIPPAHLFSLGTAFITELLNRRAQLQANYLEAAHPVDFGPHPECPDPNGCIELWNKIWARNYRAQIRNHYISFAEFGYAMRVGANESKMFRCDCSSLALAAMDEEVIADHAQSLTNAVNALKDCLSPEE